MESREKGVQNLNGNGVFVKMSEMSEIDAIIRTCEANHQLLSKRSEEDLKGMIVDGKHLKQLNLLIYKLSLAVKEISER